MINPIDLYLVSAMGPDLIIKNYNDEPGDVLTVISLENIFNAFSLDTDNYLKKDQKEFIFKSIVENTVMIRCDELNNAEMENAVFMSAMEESIVYMTTMDMCNVYRNMEVDEEYFFDQYYATVSDLINNTLEILYWNIGEKQVLPFNWFNNNLTVLYTKDVNLDSIYH